MSNPQETTFARILGVSGYGALAAQARLAKDADQAPETFEHIAMARMSARAWDSFTAVERTAQKLDVDLPVQITPFEGMLDELDARTRPTTWWERLTKTYVAIGIFTDALRAAAQGLELPEVADAVSDFGHGQWTRDRLEPVTKDDPQMQARLSLWTRRVGGEALGLVRAFLFTDEGASAKLDLDEVVADISKAHKERLDAVHLKA
ncbi:ferritin-like fold-containing protein [Gleimia hominis]|uniref:Ferritin-like fold-containing protein n=1 Tax=Gleimia hominis TaxID=595468 RepID=A0ABU3IAA9_9ACTO|nr:ferritin-like fold-containing protein [Gleimia hominis]MDT3767307.1 ferritin-like fold-containing protein [Gleimia hominis]